MAALAIVHILNSHYEPNTSGITFDLHVTTLENNIEPLAFNSDLGLDATASQMNNAIVAFVKDYCITNWGLNFGLLDRVKLITSVDGTLL